jgi:hypothetical protein
MTAKRRRPCIALILDDTRCNQESYRFRLCQEHYDINERRKREVGESIQTTHTPFGTRNGQYLGPLDYLTPLDFDADSTRERTLR